jgi:hypothetical protein
MRSPRASAGGSAWDDGATGSGMYRRAAHRRESCSPSQSSAPSSASKRRLPPSRVGEDVTRAVAAQRPGLGNSERAAFCQRSCSASNTVARPQPALRQSRGTSTTFGPNRRARSARPIAAAVKLAAGATDAAAPPARQIAATSTGSNRGARLPVQVGDMAMRPDDTQPVQRSPCRDVATDEGLGGATRGVATPGKAPAKRRKSGCWPSTGGQPAFGGGNAAGAETVQVMTRRALDGVDRNQTKPLQEAAIVGIRAVAGVTPRGLAAIGAPSAAGDGWDRSVSRGYPVP